MIESLEIIANSSFGWVFAVGLGLIYGSFFNVCIYRMPRDISVAKGRSHCPSCDRQIEWYWNIPVLSYLVLRAKCAHCKKPISIEYPLVELATGLLYLALFWRFGFGIHFFCYAVFCSSLLILSVIDLHHQIIPDELSLSGIVLGILVSFIQDGISWQSSVLGAFAGGGLFFGIAYLYERFTKREGLGGGDVKLLAMLGAWLGVQSLLLVIVLSSATGAIVGLILIAVQRKNFKAAIPFGPFLAAAGLIYLFYGDSLNALLFPEIP